MTTLESPQPGLMAPRAALARRGSAEAMSPGSRRMIAAVIAVAVTLVLGVAAWLEPLPSGMGTHMQLRMPPCGWIAIADLPCPTCGMTTAFAHAANGHLLQSFLAQPLGCILAVSAAMIWLLCIQVTITGSSLGAAVARLWSRHVAWALAFAVVAAWVYKIARHKGWL